MYFKPVILWTDGLVFLLIFCVIAMKFYLASQGELRNTLKKIIYTKRAMASVVVLTAFISIGFLDCLHFRVRLDNHSNANEVDYAPIVRSVLDVILSPLDTYYEKTYSAPFASHGFVKETVKLPDGGVVRQYRPLLYGANVLPKNHAKRVSQIIDRIFVIGLKSLAFIIVLCIIYIFFNAARKHISVQKSMRNIFFGSIPWVTFFVTLFFVIYFVALSWSLSRHYHIFGTGKIGNDIFYEAVKSIRTGLVIGTITTLVMLPFAIALGTMAGYFRGRVDDVIQYLYTTLSSIPGVLLIAAFVLILQVFIANHPDLFMTVAQRADARLLALCLILGVTSWTSLCRLLRAEALKIRELDYVQAAIGLGTGHFKIIFRHIIPNVMHIVFITIVLDFSGLVLAEAVLSYVGIGVDPSMMSWGNMINQARLEMAREPMVWWSLMAAFTLMFMLVLASNLFADAVRDAFDPRLSKQ